MKKSQLRQIIKEEISNVLSEATPVITPLKKISNTEEDIDGLFDEIKTTGNVKTKNHINNWLTACRHNIKPTFPLEEAFYANNMCLMK